MKTLTLTAAALALIAGPALSQVHCERAVSFGAGETPGAERTFYAHGCDRFQYTPLTPAQAANLIGSGNCSVESSTDDAGQIVEVTVPLEYEVADGSAHAQDNLTSMGEAVLAGGQVLRVRSATDGNNVTIARAGSGLVWSGTVGAGDTFVNVGAPGTYIAQTDSRRITKATGPQAFADFTIEERVLEGSGGVSWNGPRTARCGTGGAAVPPAL